MRTKDQLNGHPATGTFRVLSILRGGVVSPGGSHCSKRILASVRGSALEVFALSVMAGLAGLGVTGRVILDYFGPWGLIAVFPVWGIVLHVLGLACSGIGQLLHLAGVLKSNRRAVFNGIAFGFGLTLAALLQLRMVDPAAWLTLPWLGFVAIECLMWPTCRMLKISVEGE